MLVLNPGVTVTAGSGLSGGGVVALGGSTTVSANLNHDTSLTGNGGAANLGLNLANANTWTASQTINGGLQVTGDVKAARLNIGPRHAQRPVCNHRRRPEQHCKQQLRHGRRRRTEHGQQSR